MASLTKAEIKKARAAELESASREPRAVSARYDRASGKVVVELRRGITLAVPTDLIEGLTGANPEELGEIEVLPLGVGLWWPALDVDMSIHGLTQGIFGSAAWMREIARKGGSVRSEAKAAAARANGRKGGRPKQVGAT